MVTRAQTCRELTPSATGPLDRVTYRKKRPQELRDSLAARRFGRAGVPGSSRLPYGKDRTVLAFAGMEQLSLPRGEPPPLAGWPCAVSEIWTFGAGSLMETLGTGWRQATVRRLAQRHPRRAPLECRDQARLRPPVSLVRPGRRNGPAPPPAAVCEGFEVRRDGGGPGEAGLKLVGCGRQIRAELKEGRAKCTVQPFAFLDAIRSSCCHSSRRRSGRRVVHRRRVASVSSCAT